MANTKQNRGKKTKQPERTNAPLVLIVMIALSALLFWLSVATPEENTMVGSLQAVLRGLTGGLTWVLPALLLGLGVYQMAARRKGTYSVLTALGITLMALCLLTGAELLVSPSILNRMNYYSFPNFAYNAYLAQTGGGVLGALAWFLYTSLGVVGGMIVVVALMGHSSLGEMANWLSARRASYGERAEKRRQERELNDMFDPYDDFQPQPRERAARRERADHRLYDVEEDAEIRQRRDERRAKLRQAMGDEPSAEDAPPIRPARARRETAQPLDGRRTTRAPRGERPLYPDGDGNDPLADVPPVRSARATRDVQPRQATARAGRPGAPEDAAPWDEPSEGGRAARRTAPQAKDAGDDLPFDPPADAPTSARRYEEPEEADVPEYRPERRSGKNASQSAGRRVDSPASGAGHEFSAIQRKRLREEGAIDGDDFAGGHVHTVHGQSALKGGSIHATIDRGPRAGIGMPPVDLDDGDEPFVPDGADVPMAERDLTIEPEVYEQPDDDAPFDLDESPKKQLGTFTKRRSEPEEPEIEYNYPPLDLLAAGDPAQQEDTQDADLDKAQELEDTLRSFNIEATMSGIAHGPAVTRFEFKLPRGVKVGRITSLADDIAYNLAAESVRIEAPIPGKTAVGVEIPNDRVETVPLRDVLESSEARHHNSRIAVGLGKDNAGRYIVADIAKMPHVLIAGQTGSGKSVCINSIIMSILYRATPDEVKLILIDPKVVELSVYNEVPHLIAPVVTDPKKAAAALDWAVVEMSERYKKFSKAGVRNIKGFNSHLPEGEKPMPQIVIIIDELADLMMAAPGEVEDSICRLAQLARAAGMHLVIATQRPSVNVITGLIKANIPSRIAFKVASTIDSRTIYDHGGAEKLLGNGDMLYVPSGISKPMRVQGAWVSDDEVERVVDFIKARHENGYDEDVMDHMNRTDTSEAERDDAADDEHDDRLEEAVEIVIDAGQASISMLQRKMRVGYARAGRLIDEMCRRGIVSEADGSKPRSVLITKEQFYNAFVDND
ncbi:MAG: DNA translocase FtsK [Clostridia bacterium]|nr:DNA translocase FtsK [Clostridia bacterium]